jgi:hypothetical protein
MPTVISPQIIDQAALDTRNRERRRQASKYGLNATILAGSLGGASGGTEPPTTPTKSLLGS